MRSRFLTLLHTFLFLTLAVACIPAHNRIIKIYQSENHDNIEDIALSSDSKFIAFSEANVTSARYQIGILKRTLDASIKYQLVNLKSQPDFLHISKEIWESVGPYSIDDWSPDNQHLVISSSVGVEIVAIDDGHRDFIHEGYYANWSPDGRKLAILQNTPKSETVTTNFIGIYDIADKIGCYWSFAGGCYAARYYCVGSPERKTFEDD